MLFLQFKVKFKVPSLLILDIQFNLFLVPPSCPRFWRRKIHLIWGTPVASAVLHLLPVLRLTGGRRLFPRWWQDLVPWLQQQPIEQSFTTFSPFLWLTFHSLSQHFKNPELLPRKVTQANKCCLSGCFYIQRSVPRGPCLGLVFIQELFEHKDSRFNQNVKVHGVP